MAQVPVYDRQQVDTAALPASRVSADAPLSAFGGGQGVQNVFGAAAGIGESIQKYHEKEKQKADDVATTEAYAKTEAERNRLTWDDKEGAYTKKGKDAFGVASSYGERFKKFTDEIENGLANEEQKRIYQKIKLKSANAFDQDLQQHTLKESKEYEAKVTESAISVARMDAINGYQNPGRVENAIGLQMAMAEEHSRRNGLPEEFTAMKKAEISSKTYSDVISRMLANKQDITAKNYYESVKDKIFGDEKIRIEKAVEDGSTRGAAQRNADKFWVESGGDFSKAMDSASKISNPEERDATENSIREKQTNFNIGQKAREDKLFTEAANTVEATKAKPDSNTWSQLSLGDKQKLEERIRQLNEGYKIPRNTSEYYQLKTMAATTEFQEAFMKKNLLQYNTSINGEQLSELIKDQTDLRKGKNLPELNDFQTKQQIINDRMLEFGIDPTPKKGSKEAEKARLIRDKISEVENAQMNQTGKKLTNEEFRKIVDGFFIQGTKPDSGFFGYFKTKKPLYEAQPGEELLLSSKDIPAMDRIQITDSLKKHNKPVTEKAIMDAYNEAVLKKVRNPRGQ